MVRMSVLERILRHNNARDVSIIVESTIEHFVPRLNTDDPYDDDLDHSKIVILRNDVCIAPNASDPLLYFNPLKLSDIARHANPLIPTKFKFYDYARETVQEGRQSNIANKVSTDVIIPGYEFIEEKVRRRKNAQLITWNHIYVYPHPKFMRWFLDQKNKSPEQVYSYDKNAVIKTWNMGYLEKLVPYSEHNLIIVQ
ncbi:MAG TPA: hypothetical protein VK158_00880 [Acidobacteriota bacterium]|nr:hypothetical protein [Acidobacteriota bacterium]